MRKLIFLIVVLLSIPIFCDSCDKDALLKKYDKALKITGNLQLTPDHKLKGQRVYGIDKYTGTYKVSYDKATTKEIVFGGTTIERKNPTIHLKLELEDCRGKIKVIMKLKGKEEVLGTKPGTYEYDFNVKDGSNYLLLETKKFSGNVSIEIN